MSVVIPPVHVQQGIRLVVDMYAKEKSEWHLSSYFETSMEDSSCNLHLT